MVLRPLSSSSLWGSLIFYFVLSHSWPSEKRSDDEEDRSCWMQRADMVLGMGAGCAAGVNELDEILVLVCAGNGSCHFWD